MRGRGPAGQRMPESAAGLLRKGRPDQRRGRMQGLRGQRANVIPVPGGTVRARRGLS